MIKSLAHHTRVIHPDMSPLSGLPWAKVSLSVVSEPRGSGMGQMLNKCPKKKRVKKDTWFLQILPAFLEWCGVEKGGQDIAAGCWAAMPPTVQWTERPLSRVPAS